MVWLPLRVDQPNATQLSPSADIGGFPESPSADDLMTVVEENGDGHDAYILHAGGQDEVERQLDAWAGEYWFNVASAKREQRHLLRAM